MATPTSGAPTNAERATDDKKLNRGASSDLPPAKSGGPAAATPADNRRAAAEAEQRDRQKYEAVGLVPGTRYEFNDAKQKSSYVAVDQSRAAFIDRAGRTFVSMSLASLWEVVETTGDHLERATSRYDSSEQFREAQVKQYYSVFRPGNERAANVLGSGQFRYEISRQHLADSVSNELEHVAKMLGLASAAAFFDRFADKDPGMECWGTTAQNLLKARGLVPPTLERRDFERNYATILDSLPAGYKNVLFGSLRALKQLGPTGTRTAIEAIQARFTGLEWAQFTGMSGRKATVTLLTAAEDVAVQVRQGHAVFVGVPGHYKSAIGVSGSTLEYDDPLGFWGHRLYDGKPVRFGVVIR